MSAYRPTEYAIRAKWDELYKSRLDAVTKSDMIAALEQFGNGQYLEQLARERDWSSVGRVMEVALRLLWSRDLSRDAETWADTQEEVERAKYDGKVA